MSYRAFRDQREAAEESKRHKRAIKSELTRNRAEEAGRRCIRLAEGYVTPETATRRQQRDALERARRLEAVGFPCDSEFDLKGIGLALEFDRFD